MKKKAKAPAQPAPAPLPLVFVPTIENRLRRARQYLVLAKAAAQTESDDDAPKVLEAISFILAKAIDQLYWVANLADHVENLPAPGSEQDEEMADGAVCYLMSSARAGGVRMPLEDSIACGLATRAVRRPDLHAQEAQS